MYNYRRRPPNGGIDLKVLIFGIVVILLIGYLIFPSFFQGIYAFFNPAALDNSDNTGNVSGTSALSTSDIQKYLNTSNPGNDIAAGYWILSGGSDGSIKKFTVSSDSYAFLQGLIQIDSKGNAQNMIFMVANGQISQYTVSNEVFSIVTDLATIYTRTSSSSSTTTPSISSGTTPNESSDTSSDVSSGTTSPVSPTSP